MKLLKRLMHGYHLARYLLILCAIGSLWWEGESVWGAGVLAILMVGIPYGSSCKGQHAPDRLWMLFPAVSVWKAPPVCSKRSPPGR